MPTEADLPTPKKAVKQPKSIQDARLSKDGQWRLFPIEGNLLQYVGTGIFYGRVKAAGKTIRRKLYTNVYTTAKLRLLDFLKDQKTEPAGDRVEIPTFKEARDLY